jgi:hypothetical protein
MTTLSSINEYDSDVNTSCPQQRVATLSPFAAQQIPLQRFNLPSAIEGQ